MNQKLLIGLAIGIVAITGILIWQQLQGSSRNPVVVQPSTSPGTYETLVETETLTSPEGVEATVDAESDRIDAELKAINDGDFSASGLSNTELGL